MSVVFLFIRFEHPCSIPTQIHIFTFYFYEVVHMASSSYVYIYKWNIKRVHRFIRYDTTSILMGSSDDKYIRTSPVDSRKETCRHLTACSNSDGSLSVWNKKYRRPILNFYTVLQPRFKFNFSHFYTFDTYFLINRFIKNINPNSYPRVRKSSTNVSYGLASWVGVIKDLRN